MPVLLKIVRVICDGPRCQSGPNATPLTLEWAEDEVAQGRQELPDAAYRCIVFSLLTGEKRVFCSVRCEHDWQLQSYVPPLSPREKARQETANAPPAQATATATASSVFPPALAQPDGDPGDETPAAVTEP